jgi:hypothetical protein
MDTSSFAQSHLAAANGSDSDCASVATIHANRFVPRRAAAPRVEEISGFWITGVVQEMDLCLRVDESLGLDTTVWNAFE